MKPSKKMLCSLFAAATLTSATAAPKPADAKPDPTMGGTVWMEYSPGDGNYTAGSGEKKFTLHFEGDRGDCIGFSDADTGNKKTVVSLKQVAEGKKIGFKATQAVSGIPCLRLNEAFTMKNKNGYYLQARLHEIRIEKQQTRPFNLVSFAYSINEQKSSSFRALPNAPGFPVPAAVPAVKKRK